MGEGRDEWVGSCGGVCGGVGEGGDGRVSSLFTWVKVGGYSGGAGGRGLGDASCGGVCGGVGEGTHRQMCLLLLHDG